MQLEDHLGDIIRKARNMSAISADAAATAAGISESELTALEASGQTRQKINLPVLANTLGLHPQKLARIAGGWLPAEKDLGCWRDLRVFTTASKALTVNAFLVWDSASRDAALFDTGVDARPILDCLAESRLQLRHIFITHSHWDHVEALSKFQKVYPQAQIHSGSINAPAERHDQVGEVIALGCLRIAHRETPGHAMDGVTYLIAGWPGGAATVAVVGDTLFAGSMGNGNGQWELARKKIREHILSLPPETLLCPGHGPLTTVAEELEFNPFF
jgi:glyoxylase-like metal-dependent hydrolase (beta-lactamase superfamily II)